MTVAPPTSRVPPWGSRVLPLLLAAQLQVAIFAGTIDAGLDAPASSAVDRMSDPPPGEVRRREPASP